MTGPDKASFCYRVSEALELGYELHAGPALTVKGRRGYDSGAPYFVQAPHRPDLLVAIESSGPACPHSSPETTARTDINLTWIRATINH